MRHVVIVPEQTDYEDDWGGYYHARVGDRPGALWDRARKDDLVMSFPGWRKEVNESIAGHPLSIQREILDDWAEQDILNGHDYSPFAAVFESTEEYRAWKYETEDDLDRSPGMLLSRMDPHGLYTQDGRKIGSSCHCEDYPCCGH